MPGHLSITPSKGPLSLNVTVVGGSIAGLAAAYALQRAGHNVLLLEKGDGKRQNSGSVRSPPNMTRILNQWGLGPSIAKLGLKCNKFIFQHGQDGKLVGSITLHEQIIRPLLADFMFIQYDDLCTLLQDLATQAGAKFRFNSEVTKVDSQYISVTLANGETIFSDVVVGADGSQSCVRSHVLNSPLAETKERDVTLNYLIPMEAVREHEELIPLTHTPGWWIWMSEGYMLHGNHIPSRQQFSLSLAMPLPDDAPNYPEEWKDQYPTDDFDINPQQFEPRIQKLLKLATSVTSNVYTHRPLPENLACERARVVLVGEAAHPFAPNGRNNTALAIEDVGTLVSLFSHIQHLENVPHMLSAYEELRQARCLATIEWERRKRAALMVPRGADQEARDRALWKAVELGWDLMDEDSFKELWGDEVELFMYDAVEKVEDWWTKWGSLLERGSPSGVVQARSLEVSISRDGW